MSCKNVETGCNKHYLEPEIKHGTVLTRVHDETGKEIYRATLHPHHNDKGHAAYAVDSEYGIKHPSFTSHANDVAKRLSGEHKGGSLLYNKHKEVYNDSGNSSVMHPNATKEHIDKALNDKSESVREEAIRHPNATKEHIDKALNDKEPHIRQLANKMRESSSENIKEDVSIIKKKNTFINFKSKLNKESR